MKQEISTPASGVAPDIAAPSGLFDNKAALTARPVIPLAEHSAANSIAAPRRSWLVAAIAISAIIGSLTGIAAFSFYQRRQASRASATQSTAAPAETATTLPAASSEAAESETAAGTIVSRGKSVAPDVRATVGVEPDATTAPIATRAASNAVAKPTTEIPTERPRADEKKERQAVRAGNSVIVKSPEAATRNEKPVPAAERPTPERAGRATARRSEPLANSSDEESERSSRPGYVDAVRRAIGDRPARRTRRSGDANGERVREIFEGQPPRR